MSSRVTPLGLEQSDILLYLPAEEFVEGATWDELWREFQRAKRGREPQTSSSR